MRVSLIVGSWTVGVFLSFRLAGIDALEWFTGLSTAVCVFRGTIRSPRENRPFRGCRRFRGWRFRFANRVPRGHDRLAIAWYGEARAGCSRPVRSRVRGHDREAFPAM